MIHLSLEANLKALRLPTFLKEYEGVAKESIRKNASYEDFQTFPMAKMPWPLIFQPIPWVFTMASTMRPM